MDYFFTFLIIGAPIAYLIYRYSAGSKIVSNDTVFKQNFVEINYPEKKITIRGKVIDVQKVTGVKMEYFHNNKKFAHRLVITVDDLVTPVHRVTVIGSQERADTLHERVCVALRKAGILIV